MECGEQVGLSSYQQQDPQVRHRTSGSRDNTPQVQHSRGVKRQHRDSNSSRTRHHHRAIGSWTQHHHRGIGSRTQQLHTGSSNVITQKKLWPGTGAVSGSLESGPGVVAASSIEQTAYSIRRTSSTPTFSDGLETEAELPLRAFTARN